MEYFKVFLPLGQKTISSPWSRNRTRDPKIELDFSGFFFFFYKNDYILMKIEVSTNLLMIPSSDLVMYIH